MLEKRHSIAIETCINSLDDYQSYKNGMVLDFFDSTLVFLSYFSVDYQVKSKVFSLENSKKITWSRQALPKDEEFFC